MYQDYLRLGSVERVGAKYGGRSRQSVFELFRSRGLPMNAKTFKTKVIFEGVAFTLHGGRGEGYLTATTGPRQLLHHLVWEKHHGPIPRGHNVCFRDGNPLNCSPDNLVCLPIAEATKSQLTRRVGGQRSPGKRHENIPPAQVRALHVEYEGGASLRAIAARIQRSPRWLSGMFRRLGLDVRENAHRISHTRRDGSFPARPLISARQLMRVADSLPSITVPQHLKRDWSLLPLELRGRFLRRLRRRLKSEHDRPASPFSTNVEPFDYATPAAHELAARDHAVASLKLCSQGVIWENGLWLWDAAQRAYCRSKKPLHTLHRAIWQQANGRRVPRGHCVCFADSNPNNLAPANLILRSKSDVLAEQGAIYLFRSSREKTALLLKRSRRSRQGSHDPLDSILHRK